MVIRSYFQQMHPNVCIRWLKQQSTHLNLGYILTRAITWAKDTRKLRRLLRKLDYVQVDLDHPGSERKDVCLGGEEVAGEPTQKVLAVFCSMLWRERPQLLAGKGSDPDGTDLPGAGGSLQVWTKKEKFRADPQTGRLVPSTSSFSPWHRLVRFKVSSSLQIISIFISSHS